VPSLDAVSPEVFNRINRPHPQLSVETVIDGLKRFSHRYERRILLEVMLVRGLNDTDEEIEKLIEVIRTVRHETVQLNTVVRPPSESSARPVDPSRLEAIREQFAAAGIDCEIIAEFKGGPVGLLDRPEARTVLDLLGRRPCTIDDIAASLGYQPKEIEKVVKELQAAGQIYSQEKDGRTYYGGK
jgi:wyosine [tRNA(Phe)-imidazoG37] synthetase (radical SAM superfamily)